jgi:aspartyl protease family protein
MFMRTALAAIFVIALCIVLAPNLEKESMLNAAKTAADRQSGADDIAGGDINTATDTASTISKGGEVELARDPDGHFRASVRVNGSEMMMMIDSGASVVVLSEAQARAAGISIDSAAYSGRAQTAGGTIETMPITIGRISVGGIERTNIAAVVVRGDLPQPLLGQSFLSTIDSVNVSGNRMRLN